MPLAFRVLLVRHTGGAKIPWVVGRHLVIAVWEAPDVYELVALIGLWRGAAGTRRAIRSCQSQYFATGAKS
jgi:hypothetical protein